MIWLTSFGQQRSSSSELRSERGVASIDHETVGRVIRGCLAHEIHRDAAEIAGLAEPAHRDSRHHIGHELLVAHDAGGHVALDPAGQAKHPSTRPNRSSVALIADLTDAGLLTSQTKPSSLPAEPAMLASAFLFLSALRPQMDTLQPAAARACAMPRPIPPLPPVMMATRPVRSKILRSVSNLVGAR